MNKATTFLIIGVLVVAAVVLLPVTDWLQSAVAWIDANRAVSWLVFILMYVTATVLLLPGSLLTLVAGFVFGLGYGFAMVSFSSVVGASLAFLIGRFFAREWVAERLTGMPRFAALDAAIAERGALIVLLTRLSPVFPFNLLNYALGLTAKTLPPLVFFQSLLSLLRHLCVLKQSDLLTYHQLSNYVQC